MKVRNPVTFPTILLLVLVIISSGCSAWDEDSGSNDDGTPGMVNMIVDGGSFVPAINQSLHIRYDEDMTIYEVLSRVASLSKENNQIVSAGSIVLHDTLQWEVERNGKKMEPGLWGQKIKDQDTVTLSIVPATPIDTSHKDGSAIVLKLHGGSNNFDLRLTLARLYDPTMTVRDVLISADEVQLTDNQKYLESIHGYTPRISERWVIKVNNKEIVAQGLDMTLDPGDEVRVEIGEVT